MRKLAFASLREQSALSFSNHAYENKQHVINGTKSLNQSPIMGLKKVTVWIRLDWQ